MTYGSGEWSASGIRFHHHVRTCRSGGTSRSSLVDAPRAVELDHQRVGHLPLAAVELDHCIRPDWAVPRIAQAVDCPAAVREVSRLLALVSGRRRLDRPLSLSRQESNFGLSPIREHPGIELQL